MSILFTWRNPNRATLPAMRFRKRFFAVQCCILAFMFCIGALDAVAGIYELRHPSPSPDYCGIPWWARLLLSNNETSAANTMTIGVIFGVYVVGLLLRSVHSYELTSDALLMRRLWGSPDHSHVLNSASSSYQPKVSLGKPP